MAAFYQTAGHLKLRECLIHEGLTFEQYKELRKRLRADHGNGLDIGRPEKEGDQWTLKVIGHRVELS